LADFKIVLSDPETGKAYNIELGSDKAGTIVGRPTGGEVDGAAIGLSGYKLRITGGSDGNGIPMRPDIPEGVRRKVLISSGPGFKSTRNGIRRRKTVRGRVVTTEIVQVNAVVTKKGKKSLDSILGGGDSPEKTEKKAPEKTDKKTGK